MRICAIIDAWDPLWGGGQTHAYELYKALTLNSNLDITIFTRAFTHNGKFGPPGRSKINRQIEIIRIGERQSFFNLWARLSWVPKVMLAIYREHVKTPFTLIHAHAYFGIIPGILLKHIFRIPIVVTVHGAHNMDQNNNLVVSFLERILLTLLPFDQEITVSKSFLKYHNINKPIVIPNGVNSRLFKLPFRKMRNNAPHILWIGRMERVKGLDILLEAIVPVVKKIPHLKLYLVGDGSQKKFLQEQAIVLGLEDNVIFKPSVRYADIHKEYQESDIVVLPSRAEGASISILEGLASGKPIIATQVGDSEQILGKGFGLLVAPGNVSELRRAISAYCKKLPTIEERRQMRRSVSNYNWKRIAQLTLGAYEEALKDVV